MLKLFSKYNIFFSLIIVFFGLFLFSHKVRAEAVYNWTNVFGGTQSDHAWDHAIAPDGSIYITGTFESTADFDPGAGTDNRTSNGSTDIFVSKYTSNGSYVWTNVIGGTTADTSQSIVVDSNGDVYFTGSFSGTVDFDPSGSTDNRVSSGGADIFLSKYASDGSYIWTNVIGGTGADTGYGVTVFGDQVYITGSFSGTVDFDPSGSTDNQTSNGGTDIFISNFALNGNYEWTNSVGGSFNDSGSDISVYENNFVVIGGYYRSLVDFDPGAGTDNETANGFTDIFTSSYTVDGTYQWTNAVGGSGVDQSNGIVVSSNGFVYATGRFESTVDFDPSAGTDNISTPTNTVDESDWDVYVTKYNSDGSYVWTNTVGGTGNEEGFGIDTATDGTVYVSGNYNSTTDFDPGAGTDNRSTVGSRDMFFSKYNSDSSYEWTNVVGSSFNDNGYSIKTDNGIVYTSGSFANTADFDPSDGVDNYSPVGSFDVFLSKFVDTTFGQGASPIRIVLRDSELSSTTSDVEIWFETSVDLTADSIIQVTYDTAFTGGASLTLSDIDVTCDPNGLDPLSGTGLTSVTLNSSSNGFFELDLNTDTCSDWVVIDINGDGGNQLTNPVNPGNYNFAVAADDTGDGSIDINVATLAYVQDENDIQITANVPPVLDMELYETNVDTLLNGTGANTCELGVLSINTISTCTYDIGTGTNNSSGVSVYIQSDGDLRDGSGNTIDACSGTNCDSLGGAGVDAGEEEYGIYISELGGGEYTAGGSFSTQHQGIPTVETLFASSSTTGSGTTTGSVAQRLEVTHAASISTATTQGSYSHIVTYTAFTN